MTSQTVLEANGLSKKCCRDLRRSRWYCAADIAREMAARGPRATLRPGEFWAVDDVSFALRRGEALAIVGRNGAGKTMLLKLLYGLLKPDRGSVTLRGHVGAVLELGIGFNPWLSGRENVLVAASQHGLSRLGARHLVAAVAEFAQLEDAMDASFQSYSSGMKARLAYATAALLKPDVLLIDEVLAVGDFAFQRRCLEHMRLFIEAGGALVLVSHFPRHIQAICQRGVLLDQGRPVFQGTAVATVARHLEEKFARPAPRPGGLEPGPVMIERVSLTGLSCGDIRTGEAIEVALSYRAAEPLGAVWGFGIWTADESVCITGAYEAPERARTLAGAGVLTCVIPRLSLLPGRYVVRAAIADAATQDALALFGWDTPGAPLEVRGPADRMTNSLVHMGQLVNTDVVWSRG